MTQLEYFASFLGVLCVWLAVKQNVWNWPIGAVMVALYAWIFWSTRLYADAALQVFFFISQFYGWYQWLQVGEKRRTLAVSRTPVKLLWFLALLGLVLTVCLARTLSKRTDQALPYGDAPIAVFSLIAQWMLARKLLENWLVWIAVDALAIFVYWSKQLYPTAVLYALFMIMAAAGYLRWRNEMP